MIEEFWKWIDEMEATVVGVLVGLWIVAASVALIMFVF